MKKRVYSATREESLAIAFDRSTKLYDKSKLRGCQYPGDIWVYEDQGFGFGEWRKFLVQVALGDIMETGKPWVVISGEVPEEQIQESNNPGNPFAKRIGLSFFVDRVLDLTDGKDITSKFLD